MNKKSLFSLALLSVFALSGCKPSLPGAPGGAVSQQATDAAIAELLKDISDPLIRQHLTKQFQVKAYRTITDASGRGQISTTEIVVEGESAKFRTAVSEADKPVSDMIVIGDTTYVKDLKDGAWWMQTSQPEEDEALPAEVDVPSADEFKDKFAENKTKTTYTSLGTEVCGALTCYKYEEATEGQEGKRTFWFDNQELLLRREEYAFGEFATKNEYQYDNVRISQPSPTKPVPEGRSVYEYLGFGGGGSVPSLPADFNPADYQIPPDYAVEE
jgi:hypothetical protein